MPDESVAPFTLVGMLADRGPETSWAAALLPEGSPDGFLDDLRQDYSDNLGRPLLRLDLASVGADEIFGRLRAIGKGGVLLTGLDGWTAQHWSAFDLNRSALEGRGPIILALSQEAAGRLADYAPNVRGFLGSTFFGPEPDFLPIENGRGSSH